MTDYISNIVTPNGSYSIGGKNFDGEYIECSHTVCSNVTVSSTSQVVYDISSLLPNDGYDYELYITITMSCAASSGHSPNIHLFSGNSTSDYDYYCGGAISVYTTHSVSQVNAKSAFLPVKASRKKIVLSNNSEFNATSVYLYIKGFKRLGKNDTSTDYISNINVNDETLPIGGDNFDSQWVNDYFIIASTVSIASQKSIAYDISSYLPDDGNSYEVIIRGWGSTGSTKNNSAIFKVIINDTDYYIGGARATNAATAVFGGSCTAIIDGNTRQLYLCNTGTATLTGTCEIISKRKLGKNNDNTQYLSNISIRNSVMNIGGSNFDGQWITNVYDMYQWTSLTNGTTYTVDISSYLPNDGNAYELLIYGWSYTQASSGRGARVFVCTDIGNMLLFNVITRASSKVSNCGCGKIPISGKCRTINVINSSGSTSGNGRVWLYGYRRLGTNE